MVVPPRPAPTEIGKSSFLKNDSQLSTMSEVFSDSSVLDPAPSTPRSWVHLMQLRRSLEIASKPGLSDLTQHLLSALKRHNNIPSRGVRLRRAIIK